MNRTFTRSLVRRVEALEQLAGKATPPKSNLLLQMAIRAMASAWTPVEAEEMLAAAERSELDELPPDLRCRWAEHLDQISMRLFGKTFQALLALPPGDREALPPLDSARRPGEWAAFRGTDQTRACQRDVSGPTSLIDSPIS